MRLAGRDTLDGPTKHCPGGPKRLRPALDNFLGIVKSHFRDASTEKQTEDRLRLRPGKRFRHPSLPSCPLFATRLEESRKEIALLTSAEN
ncbi:hypothetical protein DBV15_05512 [Temnothorax longispinosus]|uniref:Uncharacterized protein n=1 Tax=Temnothorax longispinosus TaxID=300112 RepID=A0A4S2KCI5_9HYME|nr:hypothetical protein DBV15_05512 [Temnothorax longispinosus]